MEGALTILVFMGVIAVTALVFGVWLIVTIARGILRGLGLMFDGGPSQSAAQLRQNAASMNARMCGNDRCGAGNPAAARFCRRCGRELPGGTRVGVRRAAMW